MSKYTILLLLVLILCINCYAPKSTLIFNNCPNYEDIRIFIYPNNYSSGDAFLGEPFAYTSTKGPGNLRLTIYDMKSFDAYVANYLNGKNTELLKWTETGNYFVKVHINKDLGPIERYKWDVSFKNGTATINWKNMD